MIGPEHLLFTPLQLGDLIPRGTRTNVFQQIFWVFLVLGTLVGVVVIGYTLYNAYKYRDRGDEEAADVERPQLGEIPTGGGGGRKLFLSFSLSAIIVISLVVWTYGTLLYVENAPNDVDDAIEVEVTGFQFGWEFEYADVPGQEEGLTSRGELRVPRGQMVKLTVTSRDVFHNFAITQLRVKTDAIPGQATDTWFRADETGEYQAQCYELCGAGHSYMDATVVVMEPGAFEEWYANQTAS